MYKNVKVKNIYDIYDLGTRCRWLASFILWLFCPQGNSLWYPLDRGWIGRRAILDLVVKTNVCPRLELNSGDPARTQLFYWLIYHGIAVILPNFV
jgi:hypothetical protein